MRVRWESPDDYQPRKRTRLLTEAERFAAELRKHPGKWGVFTLDGANSLPAGIRAGKPSAFRPAGAYEARGKTTDENRKGRVRVWVKYIGDETEPVGTPRADRRAYNQAVRAWAHANGWDIADRGRVSEDIITAYENAHRQDGDA